MKNNKRMITMVGTLCALILLFVVYKVAASMNAQRQREAAREEAAKTATIMIADYKYNDATAVSYRKKGGEAITLSKVDDRWAYPDDLTYPINQTTATYMAYALASMGASSTVNLEGADTSSFGLDDPEWVFSITYKDGTSHSYRQGNYNDFSKGYYFQEDGKDTIYMIFSGLTDYFEYTLHDLADAGTFPVISTEKFDSVSVTVGEETTTLSGDDIAASFVDMLNVLQPSSFADHHVNNETKAEYGLEKPWMEVTVNYKETITIKPTDTDGQASSSSTTTEQIRSFRLSFGDDVEENGESLTAYLADGYTFVYTMPKSVADTIATYVTAEVSGAE